MNYLKALHLMKQGIRVGRTDSKEDLLIHYSYDFQSGLVIAVKYKQYQQSSGVFWTMHYHDSTEMTVEEFIKTSKENNYKFY